MKRKIVSIDEERCNGCGACATACHEGAIIMTDGKARLLRDDYCDGLGDCLPVCPADAIQIIEREAAAFDKEAVEARQAVQKQEKDLLPCGCAGSQVKFIERDMKKDAASWTAHPIPSESRLLQWPVQIKLVPVKAAYFEGARLLVAADCTAFAYAGFHERFIKEHITLIGCPKLDAVNYAEKLCQIIRENDIRSVQIVRMEVPCCGGMEHAVKTALEQSGKMIPWQVVTISAEGRILDEI